MQLYKSIATVGGFTLISRLTGFVRDALIAGILGVCGLTDAFFVAFKLPNFFRRFFAEGAFNAAFVPLFSGILVSSGPTAARLYGEKVFALLLFSLSGFVLVVEQFMPWTVYVFAPGFDTKPEVFNMAILLARITFPYILFISLASLLSGILNSKGKFAAPAGTPIILNLTMIAALLMAGFEWISPGTGMAWAVFWAGVFQLGWLWISCYRDGMTIKLTFPQLTPDTKSLIRLGVPGAISAGVVQVNLLMDMIFASWLPTGSVSYLFYADRLNQLPLGVIGIGISTALLPELAKYIKADNHNEAHKTQNRALEFALAITLPAAVGLIVLGGSIVTLLFERGAFTSQDALFTGYALSAFSLGLPAYVLIKILSTHFFARKDTITPMKVAIGAVVLNFTLNCLLIGPLSFIGLALSTAIAAWFNAMTLGILLYRKEWLRLDDRLKNNVPRLAASSAFMGAFCFLMQAIMPLPEGIIMRIGVVSLWVFGGFLSYVLSGYLIGLFNYQDVRNLVKQQIHS